MTANDGNDPEILDFTKTIQAYLEGHFLLTSGLHSQAYFEKFAILQYPYACDSFCALIGQSFVDYDPDVVVGPAVGGILLAAGVARYLDERRQERLGKGSMRVRGIFLERDQNEKLILKRGFSIGSYEKVLVVEDVVTTGKSVFEVLEYLGQIDIKKENIVGVGYLLDRSGGKVSFQHGKQKAVLNLNIPTWTPEECPLCKQGIPLTKRGSRNIPLSSEKKA